MKYRGLGKREKMKKNGMFRRVKNAPALIASLAMVCLLAACGGSQAPDSATAVTAKGTLRLATTTSTKDSGLLAEILPDFEAKSGWKVEVISIGSGEAMKLGENGEADILLVHSPAAEITFVDGGHADATGRLDVMYNDYVIIGAKTDPAGVRAAALIDAAEAFKTIAAKKAVFISRGDQSGTHNKELSIWKTTGIDTRGDWYVIAGSGMGAVIAMADEKQAYTLADRATWLSYSAKTDLEIVSEKDPSGILNNQYGVICVNPEKNAYIKHDGAVEFQKWITSPATQELIGGYGVAQFGAPLFTPNAN
jgi:tungstate transport system substrate-binding protein